MQTSVQIPARDTALRVSYISSVLPGAVVGANLCVRIPSEVKVKWIRGLGGVAEKKACTVHIISQQHYFGARCLFSCVGNVFG
jgi:hypothetical protein